jgi:hypothetical protein
METTEKQQSKFDVKKIVRNSIKLVITETFYGLILTIISIGKNVLNTVIAQYGNTSEIQRLKGETSLAWVEVLMNHNNSLHIAANGLILIVVILMFYAAYNYVVNTYLNEKNSLSENK